MVEGYHSCFIFTGVPGFILNSPVGYSDLVFHGVPHSLHNNGDVEKQYVFLGQNKLHG